MGLVVADGDELKRSDVGQGRLDGGDAAGHKCISPGLRVVGPQPGECEGGEGLGFLAALRSIRAFRCAPLRCRPDWTMPAPNRLLSAVAAHWRSSNAAL
jgi:hypothetical protein